jgi:hypothetical protein
MYEGCFGAILAARTHAVKYMPCNTCIAVQILDCSNCLETLLLFLSSQLGVKMDRIISDPIRSALSLSEMRIWYDLLEIRRIWIRMRMV